MSLDIKKAIPEEEFEVETLTDEKKELLDKDKKLHKQKMKGQYQESRIKDAQRKASLRELSEAEQYNELESKLIHQIRANKDLKKEIVELKKLLENKS